MKKIFLSVALVILASLSFQSCSNSDATDENQTEVVEEIIEEIVVLTHEDSLRLLLPDSNLGVISDFEDLFTDEEELELKNMIDKHEAETTNEIGIVTVANFEPYDNIDDYSLELFNTWGIGKKDKNNGILITVSKEQMRVRISTGIGMEEVLTDSMIFNINNETMIPFFKEDDYFGGVNAGLTEVINMLK